MAARKNDAPVVEAPPYDLGLGSQDVELPRLSIVGKLSKQADFEGRKPGNIVIGAGADDEDAQVFDAMNGAEKVRIYVLHIHPNYACSFKDKDANPDLAGTWEEGDVDMPPEAKRQFNYTMYVPQHSTILPVKYTASSTAAREARKVNSKLAAEAICGKAPFNVCFDMSTKTYTGGNYSWPGPVFALGKADPAEVEAAQQMHDSMFGPRNAQLGSGDAADKPAL